MNRDPKPANVTPAPAGRPNRKGSPRGSTARLPGKRGGGSLDALMSSKWQHWTSPPKFLERLHRLGRPALDPCSNFASRTGALIEWFGTEAYHREQAERAYEDRCKKLEKVPTKAEREQASERAANVLGLDLIAAGALGRNASPKDGLVESWSSLGLISYAYWNPAFNQLAAWLKKGADERDQGVESVGLFPARTDTVGFHQHVFGRANAGCFWQGRINFDNAPPGSERPGGTFPAFVAYYGARIDDFFAAFDGAGELCRLNTPVYTEGAHVDR